MKTIAKKPRIYVACLASYNNGCLHGEWLDAAQEPEMLQEQVNEILQNSNEEGAGEFAIFDMDNFGTATSLLGEYTPLKEVSRLAQLVEKYGEAYTSFANKLGKIAEEDEFISRSMGSYNGIKEFAEIYLVDILDNLPDIITRYIDYECMGRDLLYDYLWHQTDEGKIHVFTY